MYDSGDMKRLVLLAILFPSFAFANYGNAIVDEVTSIRDGDSFRATIADWPPLIGDDIVVRINGVNVPKSSAICDSGKLQARAAKRWLTTRLRSAHTIELRNMVRGTGFAIIADVYADGEELGRLMRRVGLAVPYDAKHKANPWCD